MSDTNNTNNKVLGLSALPHLKEYFAALCEHLIDKYYNKKYQQLREDLDKHIEEYNYLRRVIESLHGEFDSFRIENEFFGIIEPDDKTKQTKLK